MNGIKIIVPLFLINLICFGCKDNKPTKIEVDPFESALPHGDSPENPLKLTSDDIDKLAKAKGKTVEVISSKDLFEKIGKSANTLHLFYFWSINDLVSKNMLASLSKVQKEIESEKLKINVVNFDEEISTIELNKSVRLFPHFDAYYKIPSDQKTDMLRLIYNNWDGKVPGLLVVNKTNATKSFFANELNADELYAILQPLVL